MPVGAYPPQGSSGQVLEQSGVISGTATAGGVNTLTDSAKNWDVNVFTDYIVAIVGGTGANQIRRIASNTATVLTLFVNWTTPPDTTSTYIIINVGNPTASAVLISDTLAAPTTSEIIDFPVLYNGATFDIKRNANAAQANSGAGVEGVPLLGYSGAGTYRRSLGMAWGDAQSANDVAGIGLWQKNDVTANMDRLRSQAGIKTTSAANTQIQSVFQVFNLKAMSIIITGTGAFAHQALTVDISTDNVTFVQIDSLDIGLGTSFVKQYDKTHIGTGLAVNPMCYSYVRVTVPAIGGGLTTTLYVGAKQ